MFKFLHEGRFFTDFEVDEPPFESGGFGCVYKCKHKLDLQTYAVKVVEIPSENKDKILREAQFLASVEHQNIVRYYQAWIEDGYVLPEYEEEGKPVESEEEEEDVGSEVEVEDVESEKEEEDVESEEEEEFAGVGTEGSLLFLGSVEKVVPLLFIQMELCHGTLSDKLEEKSLKNSELAWKCFLQILEGLNHLHLLGIVHNDLSTKNIFFDKNNNVKIGDFGVARELGHTISTEDSLGAKLYCAPEKKKGVLINSKMDIFSAGVILNELLRCFTTMSQRIEVLQKLVREGEIPPLLTVSEQVEVLQNIREGELPIEGFLGIEQLVKNMVSQFPSERPSASEVLALLPELKVKFVDVFLTNSNMHHHSVSHDAI